MDMLSGGTASGFAPQHNLSNPATRPALAAVQDSRLSLYLLSDGDVSGGAQTIAGAGFNLTSVGGTFGAEYRITELRAGRRRIQLRKFIA